MEDNLCKEFINYFKTQDWLYKFYLTCREPKFENELKNNKNILNLINSIKNDSSFGLYLIKVAYEALEEPVSDKSSSEYFVVPILYALLTVYPYLCFAVDDPFSYPIPLQLFPENMIMLIGAPIGKIQ